LSCSDTIAEKIAMNVAGHRHERIAEEILHEVSAMLEGELRDPRLNANVTVTEVRVEPGLKKARVFVTIEGTPEEKSVTLDGLTAAAGYIRHELVGRIQMRRSPEIQFHLDTTLETARRIDELLRQAKPAEAPVPAQNPEHAAQKPTEKT
jgi:ribosome-binding factor A